MPLQVFSGGEDAVKHGAVAGGRGVPDGGGLFPGPFVYGGCGNLSRGGEPAVYQGGLYLCACGFGVSLAARKGAIACGGVLNVPGGQWAGMESGAVELLF